MLFRTRYRDSFHPSYSVVSHPFEREPSGAAWNPLSNETSLTSSLTDFWVTQSYLQNVRHSYIANSAINSCGDSVTSSNWADNEHFMLDLVMPASSCTSTPTNQNMNPLILGSDIIANSRSSFPSLNMQGQSQFLKTSGCFSRLQYRPPMGETQTPLHLSNKSYGDSNPQLCQKDGHYFGNKVFSSPYKNEDLSIVPINISSQNRMPLPQTQQNGMQSPMPSKVDLHVQSNRLAANCESSPMRRRVVKFQYFLNLCNHTLGCVDGCSRLDCKIMGALLNHYHNCRNNVCKKWCAECKKVFKHYEECCSSNCPICPPVKERLGNFQRLNSGSTNVRTSIVASDYDQPSVKLTMKGQESSRSTSCASGMTNIEHAGFSPQAHLSQSQEFETLNSISECTRMETNQSKTLSMANKGKLFEAEETLNFACNLSQEAKTDASDDVFNEARMQNMQTPCPLPCKVENFEELSFSECTKPSFQETIYESKEDLVVEGVGLKRKRSGIHDSNEGFSEGLTLLASHLKCEVLEKSVNSIDENLKCEYNCSASILSASKMNYPDHKFVGLNCAMEVQQNVNPVYAEGITTQSEPQIMQNCHESEAEVSHGTNCSLGGPELRKETESAFSLLNLFTPEELRVHISSLRQSINPVSN